MPDMRMQTMNRRTDPAAGAGKPEQKESFMIYCLMGKSASVLLKQPPEADTLRKTVQDVGYTVLRLT